MKNRYFAFAAASTIALSMLAISSIAQAESIDADTLDGLDSTDFATIADVENPVLPIDYTEPYTCEFADRGAITLTSRFTTCVCTGDEWVLTADGSTSCDWLADGLVMSAGQIWMDRNLGATQVAKRATDPAAFGDLYQWGRGADGHQLRDSGTTATTSATDDPGHGNFITTASQGEGIHDWRVPQNNNLWQGVSGVNNPCPDGFRLPTNIEVLTESQTWEEATNDAAADSPMKWASGGARQPYGDINMVGSHMMYWTSTVLSTQWEERSYLFYVDSFPGVSVQGAMRSAGYSVRCIMD